MTADALPLLLIGCGAFGRVHLAALASLGLAERVLGFDPDPATRAALPELRFAESLEQGLAACGAAIIATPVPTHVPLAKAVLHAGLHLFLEKPATETAAEAAHLAALAAERDASRRSACISASIPRRRRCSGWWQRGNSAGFTTWRRASPA